MSELRYYHNSRCSKSRAALELLHARGLQPEVINYLDTPPTASELQALLGKLAISARPLLRTGEDAYRELQLDNPALSDEQLIEAMVKQPQLIERPLFVNGERAVIGRPPEKVLELLA